MMAQEILDQVEVNDVRDRLEKKGTVKDVIIKTEVVTKEQLQKKQAASLSDAVDKETGIQVAAGCSICGMKRVRINGMKGEHTTVLVDDIPMHSTVSSYYGMDAFATAGLQRIEVARGAGASLIAPGAIGGVINIITEKAKKNESFVDLSMGNNDYKKFSSLSNHISKDKKTKSTASAQYSNEGQWDEDDNGVNEAPEIENYSVGLRLSHDINDDNNLDISARFFKSSVFGGPVYDEHYQAIIGNNNPDEAFVNDNVNDQFIGNPLSTLETIDTKRNEITAKWSHVITDESNFQFASSYSNQIQDSCYEGSDYYSNDNTFYEDFRYNHLLGDSHFLTLGVDTRYQKMKAKSHAFFSSEDEGGLGLSKDSFDFTSYGLYAQDIWNLTDALELSTAIRFDKLNVDWTDKAGTEIDKFVASPRVHLRWNHNDHLTSRISAGTGYRAPLTFFESEHGVLEDGFEIDCDNIERSISANYAISYDNDRLTTTASYNYNQIKNLAIIDELENGGFILRNDSSKYNVMTADFVCGYQFTKWLNIAASYEKMIYEDEYKAVQFLAQIEDRAKLDIEVENSGWLGNLSTVWIGSRDLTKYGYSDRYNSLVDDGNGNLIGNINDPKLDEAPAYFTIDAKLSKTISKYTLYVGCKNILDYTQTSEEESPLFFDGEGGYDVGQIWGPLKGRQLFGGIQVKF